MHLLDLMKLQWRKGKRNSTIFARNISFLFSHSVSDNRSYIRVLRPIVFIYNRRGGGVKLRWRLIVMDCRSSLGWVPRKFASNLSRRNEILHDANIRKISFENLMKLQTWYWEEGSTIFTRNTIFFVNCAFLHSRSYFYVSGPILFFEIWRSC